MPVRGDDYGHYGYASRTFILLLRADMYSTWRDGYGHYVRRGGSRMGLNQSQSGGSLFSPDERCRNNAYRVPCLVRHWSPCR